MTTEPDPDARALARFLARNAPVLALTGAGYVASGWKDAVAFVILIVVLIIRPAGLVLRPNAVRV